MIKNIITAAVLFTCVSLYAQDDMGRSSWVSSPVIVDGNPQEWSQPFRYYDHNTKLSFAFANDKKNLYICFQTADEMNQAKIMRAGIEITLTTKNKHKASITFPLDQPAQPSVETGENIGQQRFSRTNMRSGFLEQNKMMEVKGFATRSGIIPINDSSGLHAAINWDDANRLTYEIAIPQKELFGNDYSLADVTKDIALDVKINAVSKQSRSGSGGGGSGFSGRGGGGRMGGGGRTGGGMNRNRQAGGEGETSSLTADRTEMFEKSELKQKFVLAQSNSQ